MAIDWITVFAQICNFLLLVYLLKRFLYRPVIDAMDGREQRITRILQSATGKEKQAQAAEQRYEKKLHHFADEKNQLLKQAEADAHQLRKKLLEEVHAKNKQQRQKWRNDIEQQKQQFQHNLCLFINRNVNTIASRILTDLADQDLTEKVVQTFFEHCQQQPLVMKTLLENTAGELVLTSDHPLSDNIQQQLKRWLITEWEYNGQLLFEVDESLLLGLALRNSGQKISWSCADYTARLEQGIESALDKFSGVKS